MTFIDTQNTTNSSTETKNYKFINSFTLKIIACITMLIDHIGVTYYFASPSPNIEFYYLLRSIGRVAFPIFCFLLVEGFFYTKNIYKYLKRLLIFALISEIPFDIAISGSYFNFQGSSVFVTLFLGLMAVFIINISKSNIHNVDIYSKLPEQLHSYLRAIMPIVPLVGVVFTCYISIFLLSDYSVFGVLLIVSFYIFRNMKLILLLSTFLLTAFLGSQIELYCLFAFVFIFLYNNKKGYSGNKTIQYAFYLFYPLHLLILYALRFIFIF